MWVSHNQSIRESKVLKILTDFMLYNGIDNDRLQFDLQVLLDEAVVRGALEHGIEEIDLNVGSFRPTLEELIHGGELPDNGLIGVLKGLIPGRVTADQQRAAQNISAKLVLKSGRSWDMPDIKEFLSDFSNKITRRHEDEFVIITKNGMRLTHDKVSLTRSCSVQGDRRVIHSRELETEMRRIYRRMVDDEVIFGE